MGYVHGDVFLDNMIYIPKSDQLVIVDWEEICYEPLVFDVAMTVVGCCYVEKEGARSRVLDKHLMDVLLKGYGVLV